MKLERDMPQLIPMHEKRIRLYYRGINKRCTNCFGNHQGKNCKEEKVSWIKYFEQFITNLPEMPKETMAMVQEAEKDDSSKQSRVWLHPECQ
jgi:hypothetical protein